MSNSPTFSIASSAAPSSGVTRVAACVLVLVALLYTAATSILLPLPDINATMDLFFAASIPGLTVIMLLWAARPLAFPPSRRRALVATMLLGAVGASFLPVLLTVA